MKPIDLFFTPAMECHVDIGRLHTFCVMKPEIDLTAWGPEAHGAGWELHAHFIVEGSKCCCPESFRSFDVSDEDFRVSDRHFDGF